MSDIEHILDGVADDLSWLSPPPVFVGGATIGLFLDAFGRSHLRPTKDIDCIVPEVSTRQSWWDLEAELGRRGWNPDASGPICRYRSPNGALVDLMPTVPEVLGFQGRWYPAAVASAQLRRLVTGRGVRTPTPELLLACKLEAWRNRGRDDPLLSSDLEDIAALLEGCRELEQRVTTASAELRSWIAVELGEVLRDAGAREALLGHLPRGGDQGARERRVLALVEALAAGAGKRQ